MFEDERINAERIADLEEKMNDLSILVGGIDEIARDAIKKIALDIEHIYGRISAHDVGSLTEKIVKEALDKSEPNDASLEQKMIDFLIKKDWFYCEPDHKWIAPLDWPRVPINDRMTLEEAYNEYRSVTEKSE